MGHHLRHHWGHHRRFAPTIDIAASFGPRSADDGEGAGDAPQVGEAAAGGAAARSPQRSRGGGTRGVGALVRNGLSRLLAVDF